MYIKKTLLLFTVEVGVAEKPPKISVRMCIYHSNLERPPFTHEGHIILNIYS